MSNAKSPVITYQLRGVYSYDTVKDPELEFNRFLDERSIDEWLEHALQLVYPNAHVRITVEVME